MASLSEQVAITIQTLRNAHGWSQETLAERAGLSRDAVSRIERFDREARLETLLAIAGALGTTVAKLVEGGAPSVPTTARQQVVRRLERSLARVSDRYADSVLRAVEILCEGPADSRLGVVAEPRGDRGYASKRRRKRK